MANANRSRTRGPLRESAGDSPRRQLLVWLLRGVVSMLVLLIGFAIIWLILTPNMIDGLSKQLGNL